MLRHRPKLRLFLALLALVWCAAATASSALAQPDCADQTNCPQSGSGSTETVFLPTLLIDLFKSTPPEVTPQTGLGTPGATTAVDQPTTPPPSPAPGNSGIAVTPIATNGDFVPDEVLVTIAGDATIAQQIAASLGLQIRSSRTSFLLSTSLVRFGIPDGRSVGTVLAQLQQDGRITDSGANHVYTLQQAVLPEGFAFEKIAFDPGDANGANIRIAVIDTARDIKHPALVNINVQDFNALPDVPVQNTDHGTSIVGLIAGQDAFQGLAPGAKILHARAFENGKSNADAILASLDWAAEQKAQIINMSFVGPRNKLFELACAAAIQRGIVLVAAAGNNGPTAPFAFPAAYKNVIAVTATDEKNQRMPQANIGSYIEIAAPGVGVMAPIPGGGFDLETGTSFAAAIYTGAIASLMHSHPDKTGPQLERLISKTALDLGAKGRDAEFGFGLVSLKSALSGLK